MIHSATLINSFSYIYFSLNYSLHLFLSNSSTSCPIMSLHNLTHLVSHPSLMTLFSNSLSPSVLPILSVCMVLLIYPLSQEHNSSLSSLSPLPPTLSVNAYSLSHSLSLSLSVFLCLISALTVAIYLSLFHSHTNVLSHSLTLNNTFSNTKQYIL